MTSIDDRLYAAITMAKAGQKAQARQIVASILQADQNNANAWLVMAQLVDDRREVIQCLKQVLRLDPSNARAAAYLKRLDPSTKAAARSASAQAAQVRQSKPRRGSMLPIMIGLVGVALIGGAALAAAAGFGLIRSTNGTYFIGVPTPVTPLAAAPLTPTGVPTAIETPTITATFTPTVTSTPTDTLTPTQTVTPRPSATPRPTRTIRPTNTPAPTNVAGIGTPTLAPSVTLPSGFAATQPISRMNVTYETEYYEFEASTEQEIRQAIQTMGPDVTDGGHAIASTEYRFRMSWREVQQGAACSMEAPFIQLDIVYTYPEWIPVGTPTALLSAQWDEFIAHVTEHEEYHAELAIECGRDLLAAMDTIAPANSCTTLDTIINQVYDNELEACAAIQEAFDDAEGFTTFPLP